VLPERAYDRPGVLQRRVQLSLLAAQAVGVATLLRSIAYDRWITVLASLFLIGGAIAAQRGRTWGVGMAFASAMAFPVAFAIGIAPAWFCLVGLAGALPFALTFRPFARFDKGATMLLAAIAATAGAGAAIAWKEIAWSVFRTFPSLRPSIDAQHGLALAATLAVVVGAAAGRRRSRSDAESGGVRMRVAASLDEIEAGAVEDQQRVSLDDIADEYGDEDAATAAPKRARSRG
jgi:hypothetical protein